MRNVIVSSRKYINTDIKWQTTEMYTGVFHGYGINYEEFESGPAQFTVAIVEHQSGTVELVPVQLIKFID